MSRRTSVFWAVVILFVGLGCSKARPQIRVGLNSWPGYEFLYLAQEKGFYREAGVDVRIVEFNSLSDCRRAYERGQIDVMGTTVVEVLQVCDQSNRAPQIVRVVDASAGADVILAKPSIKTGAELRNARIGVELASVGIYILGRGLEKNGLSLADVQAVSMDQTSMESALSRGELDAIVSYPPTSIKVNREKQANQVFSTSEIPGEVLDVVCVEKELLAKHPVEVTKFLQAFDRAVVYGNENPKDAHEIMAKREGISPEEFAASLTDGLTVLGKTEQQEYLKPGGKIVQIIDFTDRVLRQQQQIKGADRRGDIFNSAFIPKLADK